MRNTQHTHLLHNVWWEHSRGKGSSEDISELLVQSSNAHLAEVPVGADERGSATGSNVVASQLQGSWSILQEGEGRGGEQRSHDTIIT